MRFPGEFVGLGVDQLTDCAGQPRDDQRRAPQHHPPVCRSAVVRDAVVPPAGVGRRHPQGPKAAPTKRVHGVQGLAGSESGESEGRPGADIAGPLGDDRQIGAEDIFGGDQGRMQGDRLVATAIGLADGDRRG